MSAPSISPVSEARKTGRWQTFGIAAVLLLLIGAAYLPFLGTGRFIHEEPRRALIARTMQTTGDYLIPVLQDQIYTAKPPLYNWMIVLAGKLTGGITEFSARFSSVLSLSVLVVTLLLLLRKQFSPRGLFLLGIGVAFAPEMIAKTALAEIEICFTTWVTLSIWWWWVAYEKGWRGFRLWLPGCLLVALAYLTKREPAILFFYLSVTAFCLWRRDWRALFAPAHWVSGGVMVIIAAGWLAWLLTHIGIDAWLATTHTEVVKRQLGDSGSSALVSHLISYPFELGIAALPYSLLGIPLLSRTIRNRLADRYRSLAMFATLAVLVNLPVYLLQEKAAVRYFLPMYPTVMVLWVAVFEVASALWQERREQPLERWLSRYIEILYPLLGVILVGVALLLIAGGFKVERDYPATAVIPAWGAILLGLTLTGTVFLSYRWQRDNPVSGLLTLFLLMAVLLRAVQLTILLPRHLDKLERERNVPQLIAAIRQVTDPRSEPILALDFVPHDIWYYLPEGGIITDAKRQSLDLHPRHAIGYAEVVERIAPSGWREISRLPYRGRVLLFGEIDPGQPVPDSSGEGDSESGPDVEE